MSTLRKRSLQVGHPHVFVDAPPDAGVDKTCECGAWMRNGGIVEVIEPDTPEWDESEIALEKQRRRGL